jgi:Sulfotransferase domain
MNPIIALWTHPRSMSTAFERVMMERGDFTILHEPFSYLYYVHEDGATISQQYVDPEHPTDYAGIKARIEQTAGRRPVFLKDMCAHCYSNLKADEPFLQRLTNTFLIRDPAKAIASYYAMNPDVTIEEIGLKQLYGIYEKLQACGADDPIVVDADDLEDDPEGTVNAYCRALGIPFIPESLTWEHEYKEEWEVWKDWHANAARSTGIRKNTETYRITVENSEYLKQFYDNQHPYYSRMHAQRVRSVTPVEA